MILDLEMPLVPTALLEALVTDPSTPLPGDLRASRLPDATGDPLARGVYRAALQLRGVDVDWNETVIMPVTEEVTVRTGSSEVYVPEGDTLAFMPTGVRVVRDISTEVVKEREDQYTLGTFYIPDQDDAHGEWTDPDTLQKAVWEYGKLNRAVYLQHDRTMRAGEWVELLTWPEPVTLTKADDTEATYPAGTTFIGVKWDDWAWPLVKEGKITGMSMGGTATRR